MESSTVLLAFSGGIDSTEAARILIELGYDVTALTLDMTGDQALIDQARHKASQLGVRQIVVDVRESFKNNVIDYFLCEYIAGRTPAPCTVCNALIKWQVLYDTARKEGYSHIATGHYFKIARVDGKLYVERATDKKKDQSHYLWMVPQHILSMALTPMGGRIKEDVKNALAATESRKESMGVCFLKGGSCAGFIRKNCGEQIASGDITNLEDNVIGHHEGYALYTIGQKKGLSLPPGRCVIEIDPMNNRLIAGTDAELYHNNLIVSGVITPDMDELLGSGDISVVIRGIGRNPKGFCRISLRDDKTLHIKLDDPAWAAAAGQPVIFYRQELIVGGAILERCY